MDVESNDVVTRERLDEWVGRSLEREEDRLRMSFELAYVGHAGRQKPQEMQRLSSFGSKIEPACGTFSLVIRTPACRD